MLALALVLVAGLIGPAVGDASASSAIADLESATFGEFSQVNALHGTLTASATRAFSGDWSAMATYAGGGSNGYARGIFNVGWDEGDRVVYSAAFYLPLGFKASMQGQVALMRWDNWASYPTSADHGGIVINGSDKRARLVRDTLGVASGQEVLVGPFDLPEGRWFRLEVRQRLGSGAGASSEVFLDDSFQGGSDAPNMYAGRSIERVRVGLVAIASGSQTQPLTLWFDRATISANPWTGGRTGNRTGAVPKPQCSDGIDNDADGTSDARDPGCLSGPNGAPRAADANEGDESLGDLALCGRRKISLVRANARGRKVVLNGVVAARFARKQVTIFANSGRGWRKLATKKSTATGEFKARVPRPPARLLNRVRYQARVTKFRSVALKLPQSFTSSSVRKRGGQIVLRGKVKRSVRGTGKPVIVRRLVCGHHQKVGEAKPNRRGNYRYVVRFKAPAHATAALYRAETMVLARRGSKRYVKRYARPIGIEPTNAPG